MSLAPNSNKKGHNRNIWTTGGEIVDLEELNDNIHRNEDKSKMSKPKDGEPAYTEIRARGTSRTLEEVFINCNNKTLLD